MPGVSLASSANPLNLTLGSTSVYSLSNLAYSVWNGTSSSSGSWFGTFVGGNISQDIGLTAPGAHHILVTGNADGTAGGAYGLSLVSGARLTLDGVNHTASLLRRYRLPHQVITRVLRYPAFRGGATPGL